MSVEDDIKARIAAEQQKVKDKLMSRRQAYVSVFKGPVAEDVLADLAVFCRAEQSTFELDPRVHALQEGRREVWLRIQDHVALSPDELFAKYSGSR